MTEFSAGNFCDFGSSNAVAIDDLALPYLEVDSMGVITRANRAAMDFCLQDHSELIGKMAWDLMAADEREAACAAYFELLQSGEEPEKVLRTLFTRYGEFRTFELHRSFIRNGNSRPLGLRMICVDVTAERREIDEARRTLLWLESALESSPDAVIITDALGFIRGFNPAAERLLGWREGELVGRVIEKAIPLLHYSSCEGRHLTFNMALESSSRGVAVVLDRERHELEVEIATSPIVDKESGFTNGVLSVMRRAQFTPFPSPGGQAQD